jgi:hypothetical protein
MELGLKRQSSTTTSDTRDDGNEKIREQTFLNEEDISRISWTTHFE